MTQNDTENGTTASLANNREALGAFLGRVGVVGGVWGACVGCFPVLWKVSGRLLEENDS